MTTRNEPGQTKSRLRLAAARRRRGWGQVRAAIEINEHGLRLGYPEEELRVDAHMLSRWERGVHEPKPRYIRIMCSLYALPADQLDLAPPVSGAAGPVASTSADAADVPRVALHADPPTNLNLPSPPSFALPILESPVPAISSRNDLVLHVGAVPDGEFVSIPVQAANGVIAYVITRRALLATLATAMPGLTMPPYAADTVAPVTTGLTDFVELLAPSTSKGRAVEPGSFLTVTQLLASQRQAVAPDALLSLVEAHRDSLAMLFRKAATDPVRADIGALLGETSIVASRLWSAIGNRSLAIANCAYARQLADKLDNPLLGATARIFESNLQLEAATLIGAEGDVVLGLRMLMEAASADHLLSAAARARIAAEQAQAYAVLKLGRESQNALDRARRAVEAIDDTDRAGLFSDWTPSRLLVYEGTCWLFLGKAKRAVTTLNEALRASAADSGNVNVVLAARVDLASAYAESGELEEGCRVLAETYARLIDMGNHRGIQRARRARERLNAWKDEPAVRELDERLTGRDLQ